ncbi:MAG: permease prefix domain 1-containing protein [Planctomycetota bacterium]|jgi:hypothetical protein
MFDLNKAISSWRMGLSERQTCAKSDIDELETHLREEIDSLTASKLSQQEAFLVATHRLGDPDSLAAEFAKVNASILWRKRLFWAGAGLLSYILAKYIAGCASTGCVLLAARYVGVRGYSLGAVDIVSKIVFFLAVMFVLALIFVLYEIAGRKKRQGGLLCKVADSPWGKIILFTGVFIIIAAGLSARILFQSTMVSMFSASEYGESLLFSAYAGLVWRISMPLIVLTVVILLRPSKLRKAGT